MDQEIMTRLILCVVFLGISLADLDFFFNLYTVRRLSKYITRKGSRIVMGLLSLYGIYYNMMLII